MKPIDRLGFGPTREVIRDDENGGFIIMVTPPKLLGPKPTMHVPLTADQYSRYRKWEAGMLIQDALPDLSPAVREMLITGLSDEDFHEATRSDDEEG